MAVSNLHIISFDVPYPANYGGVIDVYYKIRALHRAGISIHLHSWTMNRGPAPELEQYCASVHYYRRKTGWMAAAGIRPYIVAGRMSEELIANLLKDDHPILFEGLHTCGILSDPRLRGRILLYRESNIEHQYYFHLFRAETSLWKKIYYLSESLRLRMFQHILVHASAMLVVSRDDEDYLKRKFPAKRVVYLPSFHRDEDVNILPGKGQYALYQGKLSVPENLVAAEYLVRDLWDSACPPLVIAGMDPPARLLELVSKRDNIRIVANPPDHTMVQLIRDAQVNILITFQSTGLKLKLLNALFNGRFCLVNPEMVAGTGLEESCTVASGAAALKKELLALWEKEFSAEEIVHRRSVLQEKHSNASNCKLLIQTLNSL